MKKFLNTHPWTKVLLYFIALVIAAATAFTIPFLGDFWFFMLVSVISSWLLLRLEEKNLSDLHLIPANRRSWLQWGLGTLAGCGLLVVTAIVTILTTGDEWHFNGITNPVYVIVVFLTCFWSAIVQEFVFRGYPFQTMLRHYSAWKAQLVILIPFAMMHMHFGMSLQEVLLTTLTTGIGSVLFGLAYIRTQHLALPVGLHLGWNFAQALIPRTAGGSATTLIMVSGDQHQYNFLNVIMPFIVVTGAAICLLLIRNNRARTENMV
ncbi:MAG TPA: type II CAAX endopeptidase family protein [Mucilaginibacter sp.]|nr:type II CAAX endopeptidase family protein [Mucilaginibacter sp.]